MRALFLIAIAVVLLGVAGPAPGWSLPGQELGAPFASMGSGHAPGQPTTASSARLASSLTAAALSPTAALVQWTVSGAISCFNEFQVSYNAPGFPSVNVVLATLVDPADSSWVATGLLPGGNYTWYVSVVTCAGSTPVGSSVTTTQPPSGTLSVSANGSAGLLLSWTDPAGVAAPLRFDAYQVMESANASPYVVAATVPDATARSVGLAIDPSSTSYSFYLVARSSCCGGRGSAWYSNTVDWNTGFGARGWNASTDPATTLNVSPGVPLVFHCTERGFGGMFYNWTMGDGSSFRGSVVSYAYRNPGVVHARCVADRVIGGLDYLAGATVTLTVVGVSVQLNASVTEAAPGNTVDLRVTTTGGSSPWTEYDWILPGNASATRAGATATVSWQTLGNHQAAVNVVDAVGDTGSASVSVTVASLAVAAGVNTSESYVGAPLAFSALVSGGAGGGYAFDWSWGDGSNDGSGNPAAHVYPMAGNFSVSVTVSDPLGNRVTSLALNLSIADNPTVAIALRSATATAGSNVSLNAQITGGFSPYACAWSFGDGSSNGSCATAHRWSGAGQYVVAVTVTDAHGRTSTSNLTIVVGAAPSSGSLSSLDLVFVIGLIVAAAGAGGAVLYRRRRKPPGNE